MVTIVRRGRLRERGEGRLQGGWLQQGVIRREASQDRTGYRSVHVNGGGSVEQIDARCKTRKRGIASHPTLPFPAVSSSQGAEERRDRMASPWRWSHRGLQERGAKLELQAGPGLPSYRIV